MIRAIVLIVVMVSLVVAGSLNAFEVKFTPQAPSTEYKAPVTSKMPAFEPADKIIVREPLNIPDEVMTRPLPKYQPEPVAPIVEAEESASGQGSARETADSSASGVAEQGNAEEAMPATPTGQPVPTGQSRALPVGQQGTQTAGTQPAGATASGPVPAGGCGGPILAGVIMDAPQEGAEAQDAGEAEGENMNDNTQPQYYYEEQPSTQTRPPGIYFHDEEKQEAQQEEVEE